MSEIPDEFLGTEYEGLDPSFARACAEADRRHALRRGFAEKQLKLFAIKAGIFAERVKCADINKLDAIDMLYSAAVEVGLVVSVGDDVVQRVLARAFDSGSKGEAA
jgi:hypothetical protein